MSLDGVSCSSKSKQQLRLQLSLPRHSKHRWYTPYHDNMAVYQEDTVSVLSSDVDNAMHSDPTEPRANPNQEAPTKKKRKTGTKPKATVKVEPMEDSPAREKTSAKAAKKGTKLKAKKKKDTKVVRNNQEEYADADYNADEEEWYDEDWYGEWSGMENWTQQQEPDTYPWGMWTLIADELKLEEDPNIIHDVCVALQTNHINLPWQLKQAPRAMLDKLFPVETHSRQLFVVLHTQEYLVKKSEAEGSGPGP